MKVLISGSSGFIGSQLTKYLNSKGHEIIRVVRKKADNSDEISWDIKNKKYNLTDYEGFDAFINLSGENIFGYWTKAKKNKIIESRINSTKLLTEIISRLNSPPKTLISASAIGYYGDRGDEALDEQSQKGIGFFPDLAENWENSANMARKEKVRVVNLRIGLVLSGNGGALKKMIRPFRLGLGGNIADGSMYWSWISLDDLVSSVLFILNDKTIEGPVNIVSNNSLKNKDFTKILGKVLSRPTILPVPAILIKTFLGEFGNEALLASTRVIPRKLLDSGFSFLHTDLESTLKEIIN